MAVTRLRKGPSGPEVVVGSGGESFEFPARLDCSVNCARVEGAFSATPVLHCQTGGNVAGGFNGGGTGNKSILGVDVGNGLPLALLSKLEWTWLDLASYIAGLPVYANLILDVNGNGTAYKVAVIDPASPPGLGNGSTVTNPDGSKTTTFNGATDNLLIVNGLPVPPLPPGGPGFVPATVPGAPLPGGWPTNSWSLAAILGAYPSCKLARAASGDGGLPVSPTVTPAWLLITGDSINNRVRTFRLSDLKFNGVAV